MHTQHRVSDKQLETIQRSCEPEVEQQAQMYLDTPLAESQSMFDYLYEELPAVLQDQRKEVENKILKSREAENG